MKKKKLTLIITTAIISVFFSGCGDTTSTNENEIIVIEENSDIANAEGSIEAIEQEEGEKQNNIQEDGAEDDTSIETLNTYMLSKQFYYDADGVLVSTMEYKYDDKGNELEIITSNSDGSTEHTTSEYEYYNNGKLKKEVGFNNDGSIIFSCEYDDNGNVLNMIINLYGSQQTEYEYDENGKKTKGKVTLYSEDNSISSVTEYEYDVYGNEVKEIYILYNDDDSELYAYESEYYYEYNDDNLPLKKSCDYADNTGRSICEYEYDTNGNKVKETDNSYDADGSIISSSICEYDADGNIIREVFDLFTVSIYEYSYDDYGNETKCVHYEDGNIDFYKETEYTYDSNNNVIKAVQYNEDGSVNSSYEREYIEMQIPKAN